ncbi:MAG: hypothetical protein K0U98_21425 [Deltaproteobacteria bacterium]|nr:hypothetical protein [Deltaproteobacteria bacterium]
MSIMITMGVDIGQKREPTAICVTEIDERRVGRRRVNHWVVRHLERLPLGTSYPAVAQRLSEVSSGIRHRIAGRPYLYVDATGIGQPIIDLLRDEATSLGSITPVYFTHGDQRSQERGEIRLGKAYLVSRLQMLLQTSRLHLPRTAESERLAQELLDYEIQVDEKANERYGAFRVGSQDDLVTALGLAVNKEPRWVQVF